VKASYVYSSDGRKLAVRDASGSNSYDYLGSLTLVKSGGTTTPEVAFAEGVIRGGQVMFFERDHLGSVRVVTNAAGTVLERNDYYPFGLRHANASHPISAANRLKFNGKEEQVVGNSGLLDYGARMYDNVLGRWLMVDPLAEKYYPYSPYNYTLNNPVKFVDPDGMWVDYYDKINGKYLGRDDSSASEMRLIERDAFNSISTEHNGTIAPEAMTQLQENSKLINVDENQISEAFQSVADDSRSTKLEHSVYLGLDRETATISAYPGPIGTNSQTSIESYPAPSTGVSYIEKPGGPILIGQAHGHPASTVENMVTERTMSTYDTGTSQGLQIPIYGIDAMFGRSGRPMDIHRANPDGTIERRIGNTGNAGFVGRDAMERWGRSGMPNF
jgi:RHS repeat-associated protein